MQDNHLSPLTADPRTAPSTHVRPPRLRLRLEDLFPPLTPSRRRWITAGVVAVAAAGLLLWLYETDRLQSPTGNGGLLGVVPSATQATDTEWEAESPPSTEENAETDNTTLPDTEGSESREESDTPDHADSLSPDGTSDGTSDDTSDNTSDTPDHTPTDTQPTAPPPAESETTIPVGCMGFASEDRSESGLGAEYIQSQGIPLPGALPSDSPWAVDSPAVLVINTHPYEGYGGDDPWYDPTAGGLALTDTPNDPYGVVALGAALTAALREQGVTVIHLRLPVTEGESTASLYARTEEAIRYYRRLYPDIGLVIDLRRSAELTDEGSILTTQGTYQNEACAQLRISVNGGRSEAALGYDLAVAVALRRHLWDVEPTISRPVRVKSGGGLTADAEDLRVLTLEMGSAGNTYGEARALIAPLGGAICEILKNNS